MTKTRIYVCGSQSVGKTTLCRELGKHLGYGVVTEAARDIMNAQKISFEDMARDVQARDRFQNDVAETHLLKHEEAMAHLDESSYGGFIFDRGVDYLVYAAGFSTVAKTQFEWKRTQQYLDEIRAPKALVLLLEPHEQLMQQDDVRAGLNMKSAYEVTFGIKVLLEIFGIPYIHITTPDTLERVKLVANIVRQT